MPATAHRTLEPEATLAAVAPLRTRIGVTRVADITRLDRIGIPVALSMRPAARGLSVDAGKGVTPGHAAASAVMESIERWHGEHARVPAWRASYEDAGTAHAYAFDVLPRTAHSPLTPRWPILWTRAADLADGTEYAVPRALVLLNEPDESPLDRGMLQRSSNGLASGNDLHEATVSGLLEVIERDGVTCRLHALAATRLPLPRVRTDSVEWPQARGLLARLDDAGVLPAIYDCTSDLEVPTSWSTCTTCALATPGRIAATARTWTPGLRSCARSRRPPRAGSSTSRARVTTSSATTWRACIAPTRRGPSPPCGRGRRPSTPAAASMRPTRWPHCWSGWRRRGSSASCAPTSRRPGWRPSRRCACWSPGSRAIAPTLTARRPRPPAGGGGTMTLVVFVGPTLPGETVRRLAPDALVLPPAGQGDVAAAVVRHRPDVIALIDGVFRERLAVWHKELLWAQEEGAVVCGAASMGAFRAAELDVFGMIGVGRVYEQLSEGTLAGDDEVAVAHTDASEGYRALSLALVNVRATAERLVRRGLVPADEARRVVDALAALPFDARTWSALGEEPLWREHWVDVKAADAARLLTLVAGLKPAHAPAERRDAPLLAAMLARDRPTAAGPTPAEIVAHAVVSRPDFDRLNEAALDRGLALHLAGLLDVRPDATTLETARARLRRRLVLDDVWCADNDLTPGELEDLVADEARLLALRRWLVEASHKTRNVRHVCDRLRLDGAYPAARDAAARAGEALARRAPDTDGAPAPARGWRSSSPRRSVPAGCAPSARSTRGATTSASSAGPSSITRSNEHMPPGGRPTDGTSRDPRPTQRSDLMDFEDLQNGFYNAFVAGLGMTGKPVQLVQPSPPLVVKAGAESSAAADKLVWQYFNILPTESLTGQYGQSGGAEFYTNYSALLSELTGSTPAAPTGYTDDIRKQFNHYLRHQHPMPPAAQWSQLFRNWAMLDYPSLAVPVASWYAEIALDPVAAAQAAVGNYQGTATSPDWSQSYGDLVAQLAKAPALNSFDASTQSMNSDVESTWASGGSSGFLGLWSSSYSSSTLEQSFAQSQIEVTGSFAHLTSFIAAPGNWYSSAALALADASEQGGSPPWTTAAGHWAQYFDPQNGELARFVTGLIVASGMSLTITSNVQLSPTTPRRSRQLERRDVAVLQHERASGSGAHINKADATGLEYVITSEAGVPIVLGCLVLPVSEFVGHATAAAQARQRLTAELAAV